MRKLACLLVVLATGCIVDNTDDSGATLTVKNHSAFEIDELYVTGIGDRSWGPNLVAGDPMRPGDIVDIDVACGTYDAQLVDNTGTTCELDSIDLCFDDATWVISNSTCTAFQH
jgi:hypothetical protein